MRIHVDLASHVAGTPEIVQVDKTPNIGTTYQVPGNGKFAIPMPPGVEFNVSADSYVLDGSGEVDGGDVTSMGFAHLLSLNPAYDHIYFNPLLTADHVNELDTAAEWRDNSGGTPVYYPSRFQTGRPGAAADSGQMPTHTAILGRNSYTSPFRPGVMVTTEIDLTDYLPDGGEGFTEFLIYWRLLGFSTTHDIASNYGAYVGTETNEAAVRYLSEVDQEPAALLVYLSPDDGVHWCQVGLMESVAFVNPTKKIRLAFVNVGTSKIYLAHYAAMF